MNSDIELEINFRFLSLTEEQVPLLSEELSDASFRDHFKNKCKVGCINLTSDRIDLVSKFMKENSIESKNTDIFLSYITEYDSRILDIPEYVAKASVALGSKITLSYTIK